MSLPCRAAVLVLICLLAAPAGAEVYDFDIICNGSPVGHHSVVVSQNDGVTDVLVDIALDVTLAGLELYRYRQVSHETWRHGRLAELHSETDDDGERFQVNVHSTADGQLLIDTPEGAKPLPADIIPTSYWNPELINRRELLDSQSGRLLKIGVTPLLDGRYQLSGDLRLMIEYQQGHWSGLHFSYFGADVDYQRRQTSQLSVTMP